MNERDIAAVRDRIRDAEKRETTERAAADALVKDMRESGADLTEKDNFEKVDVAYRGADAAKEEATNLRAQERRMLEISGERAAEKPRTLEDKRKRDFASRVLDSEQFAALRSSGVLQSRGARVHMDPVQDFFTRDEMIASGLRLRATFDNAQGVGSGLLQPDRQGGIVEDLHRKVRFLDLITIGTTDTDTVEWVVEQDRTDNPSNVPYGTSLTESGYGFDTASTTVKRYGHWVPATKGVLADAGQTRTLLNGRLISGAERHIEAQVLSGDGVGENLKGLLTYAGLGVIDRDIDGAGAGTDLHPLLDALHMAITNVRVADNGSGEFEPQAVGMHPNDYQKVVLAKAPGSGDYLFKIGETPSIWGLRPVVSPLFTEGEPLVGDFKTAQTLWLREGLSVLASDQHADFFLKGLVALKAEGRAATAVTRPEAVCKVINF